MVEYTDGVWVRLLDNDTLEVRDPNSGQSSEPESKPRHQYRVSGWLLLRRVVQPSAAGDRWQDDGIADPWWEPVTRLPPDGPVLHFWRERAAEISATQYDSQAAYAAGHVVAYTPTGREVRYAKTGGLEVQPPNDNYWIRCDDLAAIRRAF